MGGWGGFVSTAAFALYNGALALGYSSLWHGSISVYYLLLSLLRGILLLAERREEKAPDSVSARWKKGIFCGTWGLVLVLNGALVVPAALMVLSRRRVSMGMIPAITSATYTTCKVISAALGLRGRGGNVFARELGALRFADALVSILILQNTLITVVDGQVDGEMRILSAVTSAGILLLLLGGTLFEYGRGKKDL